MGASPDAVYRALEDVAGYPAWWPQVRAVAEQGEDLGTLRIRSALPYELRVTAWARRRDPGARVLEIGMRGDLEGFARFTVSAAGTGAVAVFEQEVEVRRPLLRWFAVPGRPLFLANHAWMMRGGRRGLRRLLRERV
ncbi:SRPBCC family protein [Streptomyces polyrhachis]|uniref:SRPBCC family protein n=1 Tax=Streptomyces polyrhachis TaxID=1282885 RepID=A0ABW2GDN7_9ACTN